MEFDKNLDVLIHMIKENEYNLNELFYHFDDVFYHMGIDGDEVEYDEKDKIIEMVIEYLRNKTSYKEITYDETYYERLKKHVDRKKEYINEKKMLKKKIKEILKKYVNKK